MNSVPKLFSCSYADCWTEKHFSTEFGVLTPNHTHSHTLFWGCVSRWFGRALAWHARGQRFDPAILHQSRAKRTRSHHSNGRQRVRFVLWTSLRDHIVKHKTKNPSTLTRFKGQCRGGCCKIKSGTRLMLLSTKAVAFQVDLFYSMLPHPSSLITKSWARFPAILRDIKRTPASSATTTRGCPVQKPLSATATGHLRSTKRPVRPTLRIR